MMFNLIVPIAANFDSGVKFPPKVFQKNTTSLYGIESILTIRNVKSFSAIYFSLLKRHSVKWNLKHHFEEEFKWLGLTKAKVIELDEPTKNQPETIYRTIKKANIVGPIFIKDADCSFSCKALPGNSVAIYPLEKLSWVNPQHKSYVCVDDNFYITNIIEKRVIGNFFSAGGYGFKNSQDFCDVFEKIGNQTGLYLSHIVYSMLLDGVQFRPIEVDNYIDFETIWNHK